MAFGSTLAVALEGLTGHLVEVQAHLAFSVPGFTLIGLPDTALSEAKDRVRAALHSRKVKLPDKKITVNLSPASLRKTGATFDLAIAVAILAGNKAFPPNVTQNIVHLGELGLDGRIQPVRGILPMVAAAVAAGYPKVVVATADVPEAELVPGALVAGVATLSDVITLHGGMAPDCQKLPPVPRPRVREQAKAGADLNDVFGQELPKIALEVAAAGGHHLMFVGPPGAGKTMLAARIPTILPDLTDAESVEVTSIHSIAGYFDPGAGLIRRPPFEDPHHTSTPTAIVGGGSGVPRPGAVSRAHCGVLFLDEAPEFPPRVLDTLRQPLEQGELLIQRAGGMARFPARFQLVLAANPCPCGMAVGKGLNCTCSPDMRRRYFGKLSGPLIDRIDIQVQVDPVKRVGMLGNPGDSSAVVAARVLAARELARRRFADLPWQRNADIPGKWLWKRFANHPEITVDLYPAMDQKVVTYRGADRVLRVAQTIADLEGREYPTRADTGLALMLRTGKLG